MCRCQNHGVATTEPSGDVNMFPSSASICWEDEIDRRRRASLYQPWSFFHRESPHATTTNECLTCCRGLNAQSPRALGILQSQGLLPSSVRAKCATTKCKGCSRVSRRGGLRLTLIAFREVLDCKAGPPIFSVGLACRGLALCRDVVLSAVSRTTVWSMCSGSVIFP